MKKIAILGCENSHANHFIKFIQENEEFSDVEVIGVYSDDRESSEKLHDTFGVPIMANYADAVGKVDGIIVTARHGGNHYKFAKPYIDSGIPMFIDKPITISEDEAVEFMTVLRDRDIKVAGGSSLGKDKCVIELREDAESEFGGKTLGGLVRAPYQPESEYGGIFFYAPHLVEMVCEIFGRYPISVTAKKTGKTLNVLFHYKEYDCVGLFVDGSNLYYASRMSEKASKGLEVKFSTDWYYREFKEFHSLLGGGAQPMSYKDFIASVFIINAIERAIDSGKEEFVHRYEV